MSIEQTIAEQTVALNRAADSIDKLTAALLSGAFTAAGATQAVNSLVTVAGQVSDEDKAALAAAVKAGAGSEDVKLDKRGFPWDERIHSGTKRMNADNTWTYRKGVDKALVAEVEAELKGEGADNEPEQKTTTKPVETKKEPSFDDDDFGANDEDEDGIGGTPSFSLEDVAAAFEEITSFANHQKRLDALLEQFDIQEYTDLSPADYGSFIDEANKHIGFFKISALAKEVAATSLGRDAVVKLIGKFKDADGEKATALSHIQFADYDKFKTHAQKLLDSV